MHLWNQETHKRSILLEKEKNEHGDILFLDLKDVYRNVPLKLLKFYKWYYGLLLDTLFELAVLCQNQLNFIFTVIEPRIIIFYQLLLFSSSKSEMTFNFL